MANNQNRNSTMFSRSQQSMSTLHTSTESLLFNDIIEEKSVALRNALEEFLKTQPYSLFDSEFTMFLNHLKYIGNVQHNNDPRSTSTPVSYPTNSRQEPISNISNASVSTSMSGSNPVNSRSETISSNANNIDTNISHVIREVPEINPFRPASGSITDRFRSIVVPKALRSKRLRDLSSTDTKVDKINNETSQADASSSSSESSKSSNTETPTMIIIPNYRGNMSSSRSVQANVSVSSVDDDKYIYKWCVKMEEIKPESGPSTFIIKLSGMLVSEDLDTVLEKNHDAGILKLRKTKTLVETDRGFYNLIGPVAAGLPDILFDGCLKSNGMPRTWKHILAQISIVENQKKVAVNVNTSFTRRGAVHNKNNATSSGQKSNEKRKCSNDERPNLKKIKNDNIQKELSVASTSKKFNKINTPAQYLKYKFHQKFVKTCSLIKKKQQRSE